MKEPRLFNCNLSENDLCSLFYHFPSVLQYISNILLFTYIYFFYFNLVGILENFYTGKDSISGILALYNFKQNLRLT